MLIAPSFQKKKNEPTTTAPVILQDVDATPVPPAPEDTPTVTATATDGTIESNLGQTTQDNFKSTQQKADKLADLYAKLNTQWTTLKSEYEANRDLLAEETKKYEEKHAKMFEERTFTFDRDHTCAVSDLGSNGKAFIKVLPSPGLDPITECIESEKCIGYDKSGTKIYQFAETCDVATDGSAKNGIIQFNYSSETVYKALSDVTVQKPITTEAEKIFNSQNAELEKLKKLEAYQEANQQTDRDVTLALNERQEGFKTRQELYNKELKENKESFTTYSNQMATAMQSNIEDQATFRDKLAAETAIFETAVQKSEDFFASQANIVSNIGTLAGEIDQFMKDENIVASDLAFVVAPMNELQAVNNLQNIQENWNEFSRLFKQHNNNVEDLKMKIEEMQKTIEGQTVNMDEIRAKIWGTLGADGTVDPNVPASFVGAQIYKNHKSLPDGPGVCTLRLGTEANQPGKCSVELTDSTGKTVTITEGSPHLNTTYQVDSNIVLKKGGVKVANDTETDCVVVLTAGSTSYYAGNTNFSELNKYMPLQTTFDTETDRPLWENAVDSVRVFSASQNDIHAKALTPEMKKVLTDCKTTGTCENEAQRLCLEAGAQCVGIFKTGNDFGLLSTASNDYYKSINRPTDIQRCFAEGDNEKADNSDKVGIMAKMKSHFTEFLEYSEKMARSEIMQSEAANMKAAIEARNFDWTNAQDATETARKKQEGLTATAEEEFKNQKATLDSLKDTLTSSHNKYMQNFVADGSIFTGIATKKEDFEGKHNEYKENIKHVFNHPVWKTFTSKQSELQG